MYLVKYGAVRQHPGMILLRQANTSNISLALICSVRKIF